jgi:hypothetical protein
MEVVCLKVPTSHGTQMPPLEYSAGPHDTAVAHSDAPTCEDLPAAQARQVEAPAALYVFFVQSTQVEVEEATWYLPAVHVTHDPLTSANPAAHEVTVVVVQLLEPAMLVWPVPHEVHAVAPAAE